MNRLMIPFRSPAKLTFARETVGKLPNMSQTLAVVVGEECLKSDAAAKCSSWLRPYITSSTLVDDLKRGKAVWVYPGVSADNVKRILLVPAVNKKGEVPAKLVRKVAQTAVAELKSRKVTEATLAFTDNFSAEEIGKCVNAGMLSSVKLTKKQAKLDKDEEDEDVDDEVPETHSKSALKEIVLCLKEEIYNTKISEIKYWGELAKGRILARNFANQPPTLATPQWMHEQARLLTERKGEKTMELEAIVGNELEEKGYNCIYAVGKGAVVPPRLVSLSYKGKEGPGKFTIGLVGKGVTFDSGGLNLKPTGYMEDMHLDKSGACAVLAAMSCIAEMQLPVNVVGCLALAENAIGQNSYKPSDILTSYNGKTVEITNTDAEGRLCLIDAIAHVQKHYKPDIIIDVATLTGACMVALGEKTAGLFSNDEDLAAKLLKVSEEVDESFWRLPILPEHTEAMKGRVADLKNSGSRYGGACTAAAFLKEFVDSNVKWAHLDIAGPAMQTSPKSELSDGTGFGTQLLIHYVRSHCAI